MSERFTEDEARRIFARAAERQHADEAEPAGLSLRELQEIGQAAGLDPSHVAAAIAEVRAGEPLAPEATVWGLDLSPRVSRVIPGEISEVQWTQMVARLRRTFKTKGMATEVGHTREWTGTNSQGNLSNLHVMAETVEGGTRVTLETSRLQEAKGLWSIPIVGAILPALFTVLAVATGKTDDPAIWGFVSFFILLALVGAGWGRWAFGRWANQRSRQFDALLDQFELIARDSSLDSQPEAPRLALSDALEHGDERPESRRRTRS